MNTHLPYGTTNPSSGFAAGSPTSESAARDADNDGRTANGQETALYALSLARGRGVTWREFDAVVEWGHGTVSRILSDLHKAGQIARLAESRKRCRVYVLPQYVEGRGTERQGRPQPAPMWIKHAFVEGYRAAGGDPANEESAWLEFRS